MRFMGKKGKRIISIILSTALILCFLSVITPMKSEAADKKLTLEKARSLALKNSSDYEEAQLAVNAKKAERESALKAINMKKTDSATYRWSPLLEFKYPEKLSFKDESELAFKPIQLAGEIQVAEQKVQAAYYQVTEEVNNLYVDIVTLQRVNSFNESKYDRLQQRAARSSALLKTGELTQSDVDTLNADLDSLNQTISTDRRSLEADLKKMSKMVGVDVTTGYTFEDPYVETEIQRSNLDALIEYAEDRDADYFEKCIDAVTAKMELSTNYDILKDKYGKDIFIIRSYVNDALNGRDVNSDAFKEAYKEFLEQIDSYWSDDKKICSFVDIPEEWLKGSTDGSRYIEDDPYVLYTNAQDYVKAREAEEAAKEDLDQNLQDSFDNYINCRSDYKALVSQLPDEQDKIRQYNVKKKMGYISDKEYEEAYSEFEEFQKSLLEAMKLYSESFYSFDRQTCGGLTAMLSGTDPDIQTAQEGESYVKQDQSKAMYFVKPIVQRELFELSVFIPKDFPVKITHFELWVDGQKVGKTTSVNESIRHLTLSKSSVNEVRLRFYKGNIFVDDCLINPNEESGVLDITTSMSVEEESSDVVGTFLTSTSSVTGIMTIEFSPEKSQGIKYYRVLTESGKVLGKGVTSIGKGFSYLGLVSSELGNLTVEFYDKDQSLLYTAYMDEENGKLRRKLSDE